MVYSCVGVVYAPGRLMTAGPETMMMIFGVTPLTVIPACEPEPETLGQSDVG